MISVFVNQRFVSIGDDSVDPRGGTAYSSVTLTPDIQAAGKHKC